MSDSTHTGEDPLATIRRVEREVAERLRAERVAAQARLEASREEADRLLAEARARAEETARQRYLAGLERSRLQVLSIQQQAAARARELRDRPTLAAPALARRILDLVLPRNGR